MILTLKNINSGYDDAQVLFDVSLTVEAGSCVSLMGRNGMGKTTTVRTIMGQLPVKSGQIIRFGKCDNRLAPFEIARAGIGLVPEGRQIFTNLTVAENLNTFFRTPQDGRSTIWTYKEVLSLFPRLADREKHYGSHLSGGEQQMLAIGRALMTNPRLLILDEATEGLAPIVREQIWDCLAKLKNKGQSILLIDKNVNAIARLADYNYILDKGQVAWKGNSRSLLETPTLKSRFLGV